MNDREITVKLEELSKDEAFIRKFLSTETPEVAQSLFAENNVELSLDQVKAIGQVLATGPSGELSDEQLTEVSGGGIIIGLLAGIAAFKVALDATVAIGVAGVNAYYWWKGRR